MTTEHKYRVSYSKNDKNSGQFYNISAGIDDPTNQTDVDNTVAAIKSDGMLQVLNALENFVADQVRTASHPPSRPPSDPPSKPHQSGGFSRATGSNDKPASDKQLWLLAKMKSDSTDAELIIDEMCIEYRKPMDKLSMTEASAVIKKVKES